MKAVITVEMDGAAFDGHAGLELGRILRELGSALEDASEPEPGGARILLRDMNGNTVGSFKVVGRRG